MALIDVFEICTKWIASPYGGGLVVVFLAISWMYTPPNSMLFLPTLHPECQPPTLIYCAITAYIFYNVGWFLCWWEEMQDSPRERNEKNMPAFTGQHFLGEPGETIEMVLIARRDLDMSIGVALYKKLRMKNAGLIKSWDDGGQRKLLLFIADETALLQAQKLLKKRGLPTCFIRDKKEYFDDKDNLVMGNRSMCATLGPPSVLRGILGDCDIVE